MALIQIQKRCNECEKSQALLRNVQSELDQIRLDYHSLYEKVRVNLAKLSKRADKDANGDQEAVDPLLQARALLLERKLGRR